MDREHAQRRQALRNDRSQLNFALRAHQAQTLQQRPPQVLSEIPPAAEHGVDEASKLDEPSPGSRFRSSLGSSRSSSSSATGSSGDDVETTTSAHDTGELGAKWSVHRTRIVSVRTCVFVCSYVCACLLVIDSRRWRD